MKLTGHRTDAIYNRYAIVDSAMLEEGVAKLATLHANSQSTVKVSALPMRSTAKTL
jgi:hypothetical protein